MKFDQTKYSVEQFAYDQKILGKMIGMSDIQVLEHFKEVIPTIDRSPAVRIKRCGHSVLLKQDFS